MCSIYCWSCKDTGVSHSWGGGAECSCVDECPKCKIRATKAHREICQLDKFIDYFDLIAE